MKNSIYKLLGEGENPKGVLKGNSVEFDLQNKPIYKGIEKVFYMIGLLSLLLSSCKKEVGNVIVEGRVINVGTQQPIEGATVVIENEVSFTPSHLDSTFTNANGEFRIELPNEENAWIYLRKEGYTFHSSSLNNVTGYLTFYPVGTTSGVKLEMYPKAWFAAKFLSTSPMIDDSLYYMRLAYSTSVDYFGGGDRIFKGVGPFSASTNPDGSLIRGDLFFRYGLNYTKNGEWFVKVDSVYVGAFETFTDTIYY
ncbi:MAG: hypothetical protein ACI9GM_000686 [Salibacteraceae bacterium]|jgi:hypothetical protein